ncbi:site-2 protease family protein [Patescibacteria group bacterium]|nr:site-2 protease family protein [Patescibacteria group bacterium]
MSALGTSDPLSIFLLVLSFLIILALVISMHEATHAYVANRLGDPTARLLGRISLNPTAHIDPIGTVIVPLILLVISQGRFVFGWAKPTPINPLNFRHPRRDSAIVAFAGPASNFAAAIVFSIIFRIFPIEILREILLFLVTINLILGLFNLIPVPPLDGYKVLLGVLPKEAALRLSALETYGPVVLILFLFLFFQFLSPILITTLNVLLNLLIGTSFNL